MYLNAPDDIQAQADEITAAMRALAPNKKHRKTQLFTLLYPAIVEMLAKNVTQKSILELLQTSGLKLHPARFKELLKAESEAASTDAAIQEAK